MTVRMTMPDVTKKLLVLCGPSAAGKTTLQTELCGGGARPNVRLVGHTSRPRRGGEIDGVDYHFVSQQAFVSMVKCGSFVEYTRYGDNYYGLAHDELRQKTRGPGVGLVVTDLHGLCSLRAYWPHLWAVWVTATWHQLRVRMADRGWSNDRIEGRLDIAAREQERAPQLCQFIVDTNGFIDDSVEELQAIIQSLRARWVPMRSAA